MPKYKIRIVDGFTDMQCPICGFYVWTGPNIDNVIEIRHIRDPTINRHSHHKIIFNDGGSTHEIDCYGCPYMPSDYPFLNVPIETKIRAIINDAELKREADNLLKIREFRKNPFSFFDKTKTEVIT